MIAKTLTRKIGSPGGGSRPPGEPILRMRFFAIIVSPPYDP